MSMRRRLLTWVMAALLLATLGGFAGALTSQGTQAMVFDNVHWTSAYLAATILAFSGVGKASEAAVRVTRKWAAAGVACMFLGQFVW